MIYYQIIYNIVDLKQSTYIKTLTVIFKCSLLQCYFNNYIILFLNTIPQKPLNIFFGVFFLNFVKLSMNCYFTFVYTDGTIKIMFSHSKCNYCDSLNFPF